MVVVLLKKLVRLVAIGRRVARLMFRVGRLSALVRVVQALIGHDEVGRSIRYSLFFFIAAITTSRLKRPTRRPSMEGKLPRRARRVIVAEQTRKNAATSSVVITAGSVDQSVAGKLSSLSFMAKPPKRQERCTTFIFLYKEISALDGFWASSPMYG